MPTVEMKVRKKDELFRRLRASVPGVQKALEDVNQQTADEMVATAKRYVPVDTGRLRNSIVATRGGQRTPAHSQPGGSSVVPEQAVMVTAGNTEVRYAHLVEYGTAPHTAGGMFEGAQHPGTPAQPYFWPAYRLVRKKHKGRVTRAIRKEIKKVTG